MKHQRPGTDGWQGFAAAAVGLGTLELATAAAGTRSFLDAGGQVVVDYGPRPVVERTVRLLKTVDKPVIRAAVASTVLAAGALLGRVPRRAGRDATLVAALAAFGAAVCRRRPAVASPAREGTGTSVSAVAGTLATLAALRAPVAPNRAAAGIGAIGLAAAQWGQLSRRARQDFAHSGRAMPAAQPLAPARDGAEQWPGVSPLLTPLSAFYVTDVNMRPPIVDLRSWRLGITGAVQRPVSLTYDQLICSDLVEFDAAMVCIHNRLGGDRLGNQRWLGIPLLTVLGRAGGPSAAASVLVTRAVDGWECSLPLDLLDDLNAYVVLGVAGRPLTAAHGFPARVFVPGLYGQYTGAKWLAELRLQSEPNQDYSLPRGWPRDPAAVRPLSRIDVPARCSRVLAGQVDVTGVAWAPPHGVLAVEVAVDDEPWTRAILADELAPAAWRRWRAPIVLLPGQHRVRARCLARDGTWQDPTPHEPFPNGASGHHSVSFTATN